MNNQFKKYDSPYFILLGFMIMIFLSASCSVSRNTVVYYIDELGMYVSIDPPHKFYDDGTGLFRINLSRSDRFDKSDFIELRIPTKDYPSITFVFPTNGDRYIYILEQNPDITQIKANNYKFKLLTRDFVYNENLEPLKKWKSYIEYKDTTGYLIYDIPNITVQVREDITTIDKWVDNEWKGSIPVYETREYKK